MTPKAKITSRAAPPTQLDTDSIRTGLGVDAIAKALIENLHCLQAKLPQHATRNDWYMALAYTVRDRMLHRYIATLEAIADANTPDEGRRISVGRISDGPTPGQQPDQPRESGRRRSRRWPRSDRICPACSSRRKSLGWATGGSAASPRVTWIRWRPSMSRRLATGSATNSASSIRRFETAGRWS